MTDIFISYARSTEAQAKQIAEALRGLGFGVWRDDELPAHRAYAEVIEERLKAAKAVVVIWSADAAKSEWVRSEADRARLERKLIQVFVEPVALPMPFDQLQCADLVGWTPGSDGQGWRQVIASLSALAGPREFTSPTASRPAAHEEGSARPQGEATNIPNPVGALIGRDADAAAIREALTEAALVTIVGGGGFGKTRIALEVARRELGAYEDGVWLSELAGLTDPEAVAEAVAQAMRLELPARAEARATLIDRLRRRHALLLIDNCEHLIQAVAELAEAILSQAPGVKLLLTSQEPLGIDGEQVYRLQPLARSEAVILFTERASACDPAFAIAPGDRGIVEAICRRLDGVPLAIEMAAARAPALGCGAVLQRLDDRFRILTGGRRTAMPRHRTLAAALDWSHSLLSERDATIFRRLSVFAGSFSLEAATETACDETFDSVEVVDAVSSLVAKSLLSVKTLDGRTRYLLLETARAYAQEKLLEAGELEALRRRHAEWCAKFTQPFWSDFVAQLSDSEVLARQSPELENINRALDWAYGPGGDVELGHRLLANSTVRLDDRSLQKRHEVAHPLISAATPPAVRAWLLGSRAHIAMMFSPRAALDVVDEAIDAVRASIDDPVKLADTLSTKAYALWSVGRVAEARPVVDELSALMADQPPSRIKAYRIALEACLSAVESGASVAAPLFEEAISSTLAFGAYGTATSWQTMKLRVIPPDDPDVEIQTWRSLLTSIRPDDMYAEAQTLTTAKALARRLARRGRPEDLREAMELARLILKAGPTMADRTFMFTMTMVAIKLGRLEDGAVLFGFVGERGPGNGSRAKADRDSAHRSLVENLGEARLRALAATGAELGKTEAIRLVLGETSVRPSLPAGAD